MLICLILLPDKAFMPFKTSYYPSPRQNVWLLIIVLNDKNKTIMEKIPNVASLSVLVCGVVTKGRPPIYQEAVWEKTVPIFLCVPMDVVPVPKGATWFWFIFVFW